MIKWYSFILLGLFISKTVWANKYDFFRGEKTSIENPFNLRDPFKKPVVTGQKKVVSTVPNKIGESSYSNIPTIGNTSLEKIVVTGVMLGKNRRAIVSIKGGNDSLSSIRRETMFINMLRGLHPREAEVLILVKDKRLTDRYNINLEIVKEAYPDIQWGGRS